MTRFLRKVIQIKATDSPNVALALQQQAAGLPITREEVIPGLLTWDEYQERLKTWNVMERTIGLDAEFYEGAEVNLFPLEWFKRAIDMAKDVNWRAHGLRNCLGVDAAEGGDNTSWAVANDRGCPFLLGVKTSDTSDIPGKTVALMREWNVRPEDCCFDRGGGGKQHADALRKRGYPVRTVAFGEPVTLEPKRGMTMFGERVENREERYVYKNRRAEMYHELSMDAGFAIPAEVLDRKRGDGGPSLRDQLRKFPKLLDDNGRYWLPSKGVITDEMAKQGVPTLIQIIGCSPDESDALVVAHHVLRNPQRRSQAGAA